ncbi:MAG: MAPEG family protein, partial [Burkholderiales bacterium]
MRNAIFWPLIAQVVIVALVAGRLYATRIAEMRARRIHPQAIATSRTAAGVLQDIVAADNFRNLFEVPVLFFAVCCALAITDTVTPAQLALAWVFVGLRAAHSLIHVTYNRVTHRFGVY